jgi:hypothetical protein
MHLGAALQGSSLETGCTESHLLRRKQTVEPVFGIIKSARGLTRFHLGGLANVTSEWTLSALAHDSRRLCRPRLAT